MKRKIPTIGQMKAWLKKHGHAASKADNITSVKDVIELHKAAK